ncbi:hypothetical protein NSB48_002191 [Enterococcus hirae]|nr:hypothetical protein [Enterococcus hirae]
MRKTNRLTITIMSVLILANSSITARLEKMIDWINNLKKSLEQKNVPSSLAYVKINKSGCDILLSQPLV